jgi:S-adenosylmethionine:tRNA ribosyltransferase-isomerase
MIAADRPDRPSARLCTIDPRGRMRHLRCAELASLFRPGDLVVANDAATLPASLHGAHVASGEPIEVRLAAWMSLGDPTRFVAVAFGAGDHRTRTEQRPPPPSLSPGDRLLLGPPEHLAPPRAPVRHDKTRQSGGSSAGSGADHSATSSLPPDCALVAAVERLLDHPRLLVLRFAGSRGAVLAGLARHGRPIQYAHVPAPLAMWDVWTRIAAAPMAFESPSAGFALDWRTLAAWRQRGIGFATLTHAAGISSTGDQALDLRLPFDEPYRIPARTAGAIERTRSQGGRIIAIGTSVVRSLESAANPDGSVRAGDGVAGGRIMRGTPLRLVDAILTGVHEPGESHFELLRAFADDAVLDAISAALAERGYRTHEFGDSVLIERGPSTRRH